MSLVHESLISVLDRRFVSTYFNTFQDAGYDADAAAFVQAAGASPKYGAIYTPDGKHVVSFGYTQAEFVTALETALAAHPELLAPTEAEAAVFAAATQAPKDGAAQLAAAELHAELLRFDEARACLLRVLEHDADPARGVRARYLLGHLAAIDPTGPDAAAAARWFGSIEDVPADLADDIALDRLSLEVEFQPRRTFFPGRRFRKGADTKQIAADLEAWIERAPASNRIGQMHFYLGLARMQNGDRAGADAIWKAHETKYPDDRWALLSRVHMTSYKFSPYSSTTLGAGPEMRDPEVQKLLRELVALRAAGKRGGAEEQALSQKLVQLLMKKRAEAQAGGGDDTDDADE